MSSLHLFLVIGIVNFMLDYSYANIATVSNVKPRVDESGAILDIHDGNTMKIGDTFYWFGAGYGDCQEMQTGCESVKVGSCGFNLNHTVNLATSQDLVNWQFHGSVLPARPDGILFSPWVARSKTTGSYVLWFNLLPVINGQGNFDDSCYVVATSESPFGPFKVVNKNVTGIAYNQLPDAPSIFVDDDGSGYIAFTHEDSHINHVQQLTPDLTSPLPERKLSPQIGPGNLEGILMFKRDELYYVMIGPCCCFCAEGSDVLVYISSSPLGPYEQQQNPLLLASTWHGQTGAVWFTGQDWVIYGDRWQSAPDKIKAHDFSYWAPLNFTKNGTVQSLSWQNIVQIQY